MLGQVSEVVEYGREARLRRAAEQLLESFMMGVGELRASLCMFVQTQRAISQTLVLDSLGLEQRSSRARLAVVDEDSSYEDRVEQLKRVSAQLQARVVSMQKMLTADHVNELLESKVTAMLRPGLREVLLRTRDALARLGSLVKEYMEIGSLLEWDFVRVRRDVEAIMLGEDAGSRAGYRDVFG